MDKLYIREQLTCAEPVAPVVIRIDELSIWKGYVFRIVVSDLERQQPLWSGGVGHSAESLARFYEFLGLERSQGIGLAVMDMWKTVPQGDGRPRAPCRDPRSCTTSSTCCAS